MAIVNFSVPEEIKAAFQETFANERAVEERRQRRSAAIDALLELRRRQRPVSKQQIAEVRRAGRP